MASGTFTPGVGGDDGYKYPGGFDNAGASITLGQYFAMVCSGFVSLDPVAIPQGAVINTATLGVVADANFSNTVVVEVYAHAADDSAPPASEAAYNALSLTTASVTWTINAAWSTGSTYTSPDLSAVIQEIVSRPGWVSGGAITLLLVFVSATGDRRVRAIEYSGGASKAELDADWTAGTTEVAAPTLDGDGGLSCGVDADVPAPALDADGGLSAADVFVGFLVDPPAMAAAGGLSVGIEAEAPADFAAGSGLSVGLVDLVPAVLPADGGLSVADVFVGFLVDPPAMAGEGGLSGGVVEAVSASLASGAGLSAGLEMDVPAVLPGAGGLSVGAVESFRWGPHVVRFLCILTGAENGLSDLSIPVSSFSCRVRNGSPSYLSVVTPGLSLAGDIADREDGRFLLYLQWDDGTHVHDWLLCETDLDEIPAPDQGARNRSITLVGHKTHVFSPKALTLTNAQYMGGSTAAARLRFPILDPNVRPGDTLTFDGDDYVVGVVAYSASANRSTIQAAMEITEAQEGDTSMADVEYTEHTVDGGVVPVTEVEAIIGPVQAVYSLWHTDPATWAYYANDSLSVVCGDPGYLPAITAAGQGAAVVLSVSGSPVLSLTLDDYNEQGESIELESHSPTQAEVALGLDAFPPLRVPVQWVPTALAPYTLGATASGPAFIAPYVPAVHAVTADSHHLNHYRYLLAPEIVNVAEESWVHLSALDPAIALGDMLAFTVEGETQYLLAQQIEIRKSPTTAAYMLVRGQWCEGFLP